MTPERWNRISAIFDAVLEVGPQGRVAFLRDACAGDETLRSEIERMLAEDERSQKLLDRPAIGPLAEPQKTGGDGLSSETTEGDITGKLVQGRFQIKARLGAGGMGEVYLADDPKLKRLVALKRLPPHLRADQRYRSNLLREARRASSLTDPHIAQVFDVLEEDGEAFLVMEYIEGATLRKRIAFPLPLEELLDIAIQCSEGLLAAHQKGVVHCDIKPENIIITPAGLVKILDFGIAKRLPVQEAGNTTSLEPAGLIGTPNYMAPEVLAGEPADARSDIYSLGVTLFEAGVGKHPRQLALPNNSAEAPKKLDGIALPCEVVGILAKMVNVSPAQRYADTAELLQELRSVRNSRVWEIDVREIPASRLNRRIAVGIAALAVTAAMAAVTPHLQTWLYRRFHPVPEQKQVVVLPFSVAGADVNTKAFADGLSEVLSAKLTQLTERPQFQVIPASEVRAKHVMNAIDARKEFGVNLVIEGTWQQVGSSVHVMPVLVDATTNRQLRANEFVAQSSDPIGLETQVASGVLRMLDIELQPAEKPSFDQQGTMASNAYAHYLRGRGYLDDFTKPENIESAIAEFSSALQQDPYYSRALAGLGDAYWKKYEASNDPQWSSLARTNCSRAVELGKSESSGHACLGQVLRGTGEYEQALVEYRRALDLEPTSDEAVEGLANVYASLNKPEDAEATFRKAIALRPKYWLEYNKLGVFYHNRGRDAEAADMFSHVISLAPDSFKGWSNLGGIYVLQGQYQRAVETLQHSISIRPTYQAYSNLATAFFELRQFEDAARACDGALTYNNRNYLVWGNLANALYYAKRRREAEDAYKRAIELAQQTLAVNPRDAVTLGNLASYYSSLGNDELAVDSLNRALKIAPKDPDVLFDAALIYSGTSNGQLALRYIRMALDQGLAPTLVRDAPAFDSLRGSPQFDSLLSDFGVTHRN
jgi:eukaryotic-like serine/threonine-protein kinase